MNTLHLARAALGAIVAAVVVAAIMPAEGRGHAAHAVVGGITAFATDDAWTGFTDAHPAPRHPRHPTAIHLAFAQGATIR